MLSSAVLLSRLKDEVNELIPECAIHIGSESPAWNEVSAENIERLYSYLSRQYPQRVEEVDVMGDLWLATMGLQGDAEFICYKNISGEPRLALHKKNCCFRYLCRGRSPCDVCPRQTMNERLKRLGQAST